MNFNRVLWVAAIAAGTFWLLHLTKNDAVLFN